ncbi:unnamed protein product [Peniophora sp. CBMAI 1063]|nr:unnamed protein product [Peniophora sp. CBMAI 1063]
MSPPPTGSPMSTSSPMAMDSPSLELSSNASSARPALPDPWLSIVRPTDATECPDMPMASRPSMSFEDGNIALLAGSSYFLVHRGVLSRQSAFLAKLVGSVSASRLLDGHPILELDEHADDVSLLLHTIYDGTSSVLEGADVFHVSFVLLRLSQKYEIPRLKKEALDVLHEAWPSSLALWDRRTSACGGSDCVRDNSFPHPIAVINLARQAGATRLLPAAFYDLSRQPPSLSAAGYHSDRLAQSDLVSLFTGRELASRFLSTFVVQVLEGRLAAHNCPSMRRCTAVFERMAQEVVRFFSGPADPLTIMGSVLTLQLPEEDVGPALVMLCVPCAEALEEEVHNAREMAWESLPTWFGVEGLEDWGA